MKSREFLDVETEETSVGRSSGLSLWHELVGESVVSHVGSQARLCLGGTYRDTTHRKWINMLYRFSTRRGSMVVESTKRLPKT